MTVDLASHRPQGADPATPPGMEPSGVRQPPVLDGRGLLSIFAFWICVPVVLEVIALLFSGGAGLGIELRILVSGLILSSAWTLVTATVFRLTTRFGLEHTSRLARNSVLIAAGVVLSVLMALITSATLLSFRLRPPDLQGSGVSALAMFAARMLVPTLSVYAMVAVTGLARDASRRAQARREEGVQLQARNAQLQAQLAEARLRVLRTQLNPHFLFNTLNAVSSLMDEDPRGARRMIARLSELLRYALQETTSAEIPLQEELKLVGRYLEIVEIRFQGRLETSVSVDSTLKDALVPSLILQPLAENAMKHGVGKAGGHGRIEVRASRSGDRLVLRVLDTGAGQGPNGASSPPTAGGGLGLRHTRERLHELYGADQSFTLEPRPEGGMVAEIVLPYHTAPLAEPVGAPLRAG